MELKNIFGFSKKIEKWTANIELIETKKKEAYAQGSNDSAENFILLQKELTKKIEELTRQKIQLQDELSKEYSDREAVIKEKSKKTILELEDAHDTQCRFCRQSMENEKLRFKTRQMYFAEIINKIELLWQKMYQYSGVIADQFDVVLSASAQISSSKTEFAAFRTELDKIMKEAQPYLNMELSDGSTDKFVVFDKMLDSHIMKDVKQIEKKKDGGLV